MQFKGLFNYPAACGVNANFGDSAVVLTGPLINCRLFKYRDLGNFCLGRRLSRQWVDMVKV